MSRPGRHFELRRRSRRGGPATRLRGSGQARTWAAGRWLALLEAHVPEAERRAGLESAKRGYVESLTINGGAVDARVRGGGALPCTCRVRVPAFDEAQWRRVIDAMAAEAVYLAKLLAREVPPVIEELLAPMGLTLVPGLDGISIACACQLDGRCRHAAAVLYLVAEGIDDDPLAAFGLRGVAGDMLLERLSAARTRRTQGSAAAHAEPLPPRAAGDAAPALDQLLDAFWKPGHQLAELQHMPPPHHAPHALLRRLGPSPLPGRFPLVGLLASVYDEVAKHALTLRDRAEGIENAPGAGNVG